MIRRSLLVAALGCLLALLSPPSARAQTFEIDTVTARRLLREADQALLLSDSLRFDRRFQEGLSSLFRAWGLDRDLPPEARPVDPDATMDSVVRVRTLEGAFQVANGLDQREAWRPHRRATYRALARLGRLAEGLDFALAAGDVPGNVRWILSGLGAPEEQYATVERWMDGAHLSAAQRQEILMEVLLWQTDWDFWASWRAADRELPPEARTSVHLNSLAQVLRPALPAADSLVAVVIGEIEALPDEGGRDHYFAILSSYCAGVDVSSCSHRKVPASPHALLRLRNAIINRLMQGDWDQAADGIHRLRGVAPRVHVAATVAEGLASARPNCAMRLCSLRVLDSLVIAWLPELEAVEAGSPGPPGDTLRANLARVWGDRDAARAAELARGISDQRLRASALIGPIQSAYATDVWGSLELARLTRDAGSPFLVNDTYVLMMRLGEEELAREVLEMFPEGGWQRMDAQVRWAQALWYVGRWRDAREVVRAAYRAWDPGREPLLGINHLRLLVDLDLVDEVMEWARTLDDPDARAGGLATVLSSFSGNWMGR